MFPYWIEKENEQQEDEKRIAPDARTHDGTSCLVKRGETSQLLLRQPLNFLQFFLYQLGEPFICFLQFLRLDQVFDIGFRTQFCHMVLELPHQVSLSQLGGDCGVHAHQ